MSSAMEDAQELNWVKIRAECTIRSIFKQLRREIDIDVVRRNEYLSESQKNNNVNFSVEDKDEESFVVHRKVSGLGASVSFMMDGSSIKTIDPTGPATMQATIGMNDSGRCMLRVDRTEIESWLFRKKALESLFFPDASLLA
jgi:hypothetical protein